MSDHTPVRTSKAYLESLEQLWDVVSEKLVEEPGVVEDTTARQALLEAIAKVQTNRVENIDLSDGLGETARGQLIEFTRQFVGDDELTIDDDACLSAGDDGVWVQSWILLKPSEISHLDCRAGAASIQGG